MSWINLLWTASQQLQLEEQRQKAGEVRYEVQRAALQTVEQSHLPIVKQLDKLGLVCHAMWTLLMERTNLTEKDLLKRVTDLDLRDGVLDGKLRKPAIDCPKCKAKMCPQFNRCLFCGEEYPGGTAFHGV